MRAVLDDPPFVENDDPVRVPKRRDPMGDDNARPAGEDAREFPLDLLLRRRVGRREGVVENHDRGAPQKRPRDRKALLILDMKDFPDSVIATAASPKPSWGLQMFGGAALFEDPAAVKTFAKAVETIRKTIAKTESSA